MHKDNDTFKKWSFSYPPMCQGQSMIHDLTIFIDLGNWN